MKSVKLESKIVQLTFSCAQLDDPYSSIVQHNDRIRE